LVQTFVFLKFHILKINSRIFLKELETPLQDDIPTSNIHQYLSGAGVLNDFKSLNEKEINWNSGKQGYGSCEECSSEEIRRGGFKPCVKKRKTVKR